MNRIRIANWLVFVACAAVLCGCACGGGEDKGEEAPAKAEAPAEKAEEPAAPEGAPSVDGVPDLQAPGIPGSVDVSGKARTRAKAFNRKALKAHKKKKYKDAIKHYKKALEKDPGHVLVRYNLACAFALIGDADKAVGMLGQLKAADCAVCRAQLAHAAKDSDFASIADTPAFKAVTEGVAAPPDLMEDAEKVRTAIRKKKMDALAPYLHSARSLQVAFKGEEPSGDDPDDYKYRVLSTHKIADAGQTKKIKKELRNQSDVTRKGKFKRKGACYKLGEPNRVNHFTYALREACFYYDGRADKTYLTGLVIDLFP